MQDVSRWTLLPHKWVLLPHSKHLEWIVDGLYSYLDLKSTPSFEQVVWGTEGFVLKILLAERFIEAQTCFGEIPRAANIDKYDKLVLLFRQWECLSLEFIVKNQIMWHFNHLKVSPQISQNSQENICFRVSFLMKLQTRPATLLKRD